MDEKEEKKPDKEENEIMENEEEEQAQVPEEGEVCGISKRMPNPIDHPTIQEALLYIAEHFEGTNFELGREMGRAYAERAPYPDIKKYEGLVHLMDEIKDSNGGLEAGFMYGVLEFVKEEMEPGDRLVCEGTTGEQLEALHYDLDIFSILDLAGLVGHEPEEVPNGKTEGEEKPKDLSPKEISRFDINKRRFLLGPVGREPEEGACEKTEGEGESNGSAGVSKNKRLIR